MRFIVGGQSLEGRYRQQVRSLLLLMIATVTLGGGFGEAAASATINNDGTLDVQLQVEVDADTVFAHVIDPGGEQETVTLARRRNGTFGGVVTTARANRVVVFEALVAAESAVSRPVTFLDLGVAPSLIGIDEGPDLLGGEAPPETIVFGLDRTDTIWAAVALMAVALALVAWWAAGPRSGAVAASRTEPSEE